MSVRTPEMIKSWLSKNQHRLDCPEQMYGTEPNAVNKDWDSSNVRWLMLASWVYAAAAGNSSVPAVYKAINIGREDFLCDRFYLLSTPRDLRCFETAGMPVFGIESKHELRDFDVVGTSIAYPLLSMSFLKMLTMSGMPARWKEREAQGLENFPMVMVGGLSYGAPEVLAPVVDCWWCGEVEDEPGNPGIAAVTARVAVFKETGVWQSDRLSCYKDLALEFNFLYFPRFVDVHYEYQDRPLVDGDQLSKQVSGYSSNLEGMRLPIVKRFVHDMDKVVPLDDPPLLFNDANMISGDIESGRGSVSGDEIVLIDGVGPQKLEWFEGDVSHPHDSMLNVLTVDYGGDQYPVSHVLNNGVRPLVEVRTVGGNGLVCTPDHEIEVVSRPKFYKKGDLFREISTSPRKLVRADNLEKGKYFIPIYYGQNVWSSEEFRLKPPKSISSRTRDISFPEIVTPELSWLLGMLAGDACITYRESNHVYRVVWTTDDIAVSSKMRSVLETVFGLVVTPRIASDGRTCQEWVVQSKVLLDWLSDNFGVVDNISRRAVPKAVFESPRGVVAQFISGLFDSDGTYNHQKEGQWSIACNHEGLIRDVARLMLNLGTPCSVSAQFRKGFGTGAPLTGGLHWKVQACLAEDADYSWLDVTHSRRAPWVSLFQPRTNSKVWLGNGVGFQRLASVKPCGSAETWDISVPGPRRFTASGVHVSNCPAWCSFCALTWRQKPARQRSVSYMVEYAKSLTENMGGTHLSPFSPDFAMQSNKKRLIAALLSGVSDEVDSSSMRIDDFIADDDFILLQVTGGMRSVTLGLEGGSQRMRDLVGKGTRDEDVCEAVSRGIRAGVKRFKIYMITNLPGEDEGDIYRTLRLGKKLADIRESMGASNVRIQFSWTPLMVESNTPLQWFAVQETSRILGDVLEEFRNIKIEGKIGERARREKLVLHQLCHRASRDVGEAIIDAFLLSNKACWGGVPRDMAELLDTTLRARGFHNGTADCFDERDRTDLFGWEFISQGINPDLMWTAYQQMREFAELTDSHSYDSELPAGYGGNEWIARCDQQCLGNTCGVCSAEDLKLRAAYIRDGVLDDEVRLSDVRPLDERSQVSRVRARLVRPDSHRFVSNDHWRYNVRRAAYRAGRHLGLPGVVAKRSIRFASDSITYRDWTCGVDYLEFGLTSRLSVPQVGSLVQAMNDQMISWMHITGFEVYPVSAPPMRTEVDLSLFELELDEDSQVVEDAIEQWQKAEYIKLVIKTEGSWFGNVPEEVNAKDYVDGWWLVRDGHRLRLRMLVRGKPNPYAVYAALMGKVSWLDAAEHVMTRLESFVTVDRNQLDFLRPACHGCGFLIPVTVLDVPYDLEWCPQCKDKNAEASRGC